MVDVEVTSTPSPALPAVILLSEVMMAFIIAIQLPPAQRICASVLLMCLNIYGAIACTAGKPEDDYGLGSSVWGPTTLSAILFTWLMPDPLHEIRYIKDPVHLDKKPFLVRMWYAGCIHHNWRLIGANVQVRSCSFIISNVRVTLTIHRRWRMYPLRSKAPGYNISCDGFAKYA